MSYRGLLPLVVVCSGLIVGCVSGCSSRLADLTAISTRNVGLQKQDLDSLPQSPNVVGRDARWSVLFIPIGFPSLESAVDDALDKGRGDVMLNPVITSECWSAILIGRNTLLVKGTVVDTRLAGGRRRG